jgi:hypothetical protein
MNILRLLSIKTLVLERTMQGGAMAMYTLAEHAIEIELCRNNTSYLSHVDIRRGSPLRLAVDVSTEMYMPEDVSLRWLGEQ